VENIKRYIHTLFILSLLLAGMALPAFAADRTIIFSTNPWASEESLKKTYRPILDYIEEKTNIHFDIVIYPTYEDFVKEVQAGFVQFAATSSSGFTEMWNNRADIRYVATSVRLFGSKKQDFYQGYIIVRKDSNIKSFMELEGKKFAFVDDTSTSGYKMPMRYMKQLNLDPNLFFKKYFFMGNHDEVIKAVRNRAVDGGATWEESYEVNVRKYGDIFNILYKSPPVPNDAWVVGGRVSKEEGDRIAEVLLSINESTTTKNGVLVLDHKLGVTEVGFTKESPQFHLGIVDKTKK
jgi:phosphate/phosphite/phosphonate ABC transporter binding protein